MGLILLVVAVASVGHGFAIEYVQPMPSRAVAHLLGALFFASSLANLWLSWQVDPGVIAPGPRAKDIVDVSAPPLLPPGLGEDDTIIADLNGGYTRNVHLKLPGGGTAAVTERWCHTCDTWRGPRAHHCSICGFCMERFDHHCPVVGNCVAERTHRFFAAFLCSASMGCLVYLVAASSALHETGLDFENGKTYLLVGYAVFSGYIFIALLIFGGSHAWMLLVTDTTTKEVIKGREGKHLLPRPPLREVLCAPVVYKRRWPLRESPFRAKGGTSLKPEAGNCVVAAAATSAATAAAPAAAVSSSPRATMGAGASPLGGLPDSLVSSIGVPLPDSETAIDMPIDMPSSGVNESAEEESDDNPFVYVGGEDAI